MSMDGSDTALPPVSAAQVQAYREMEAFEREQVRYWIGAMCDAPLGFLNEEAANRVWVARAMLLDIEGEIARELDAEAERIAESDRVTANGGRPR